LWGGLGIGFCHERGAMEFGLVWWGEGGGIWFGYEACWVAGEVFIGRRSFAGNF
jgi:hypothetical protein